MTKNGAESFPFDRTCSRGKIKHKVFGEENKTAHAFGGKG